MAAETKREKIARLRALLESGVTSSSVDGESASFDHATVRRELQRLESETGVRKKRSRVLQVNMTRR